MAKHPQTRRRFNRRTMKCAIHKRPTEIEARLFQEATLSSRTSNKLSALLVAIATALACGVGMAQQTTHGDCSPLVNGGSVTINCNSHQQDPTVTEEQRWEARRQLEEKKKAYIKANGGCELGYHRVCTTMSTTGGQFVGNLGCFCSQN